MAPLPKTMQAVRLHGVGFENIRVEEIPVPQPTEHQLLVKVEAAGVCSSILKLVAQGSQHTFLNGWDPAKFPTILGDEGCVRVVQAGAAVADRFPVGSLYVTQPAVDHPPIHFRERYNRNAEGMNKVAVGYTLPGHLSEYMLISEEILAAQCLLPMTEGAMPFFAGALCEPLSCVISAQDRHIHIAQKNPVAPRKPRLGLLKRGVAVVIGAGPMGRLHAEAALRFQPKHLIMVDVMESRLAWVRDQLGDLATSRHTRLHTVVSREALDLIRKVSQGRGADDIIVAVGVRAVQIETQQWLARGGVLNLFGGLKRGEHVIDLDTLRVHYDEIRLCGSSGGAPSDVAEAVRMVSAGELDPGRHLDMVGSLDQFPKALDLVKNTSVEGKIVLYPGIRQTDLRQTRGWKLADEQAFLAERKR
jgi:threonine dehydrogenase-like Zn-dependent dehydrogenase